MSDIHGAVGSYVVDALDPDEQAEFEQHLATCELCRLEVDELSETAADLGALTLTAPPPSVRAGVLSAIRDVRPLPPPEPERLPEVPQQPEVPRQQPVDELALRRSRRSSRVLTFAVAAATVVALALGGWVYALNGQQQVQVAAERFETELLAAPDARVYPTELDNGGRGSFVVSQSLNRAVFVGGNLPDPGANNRYQLWTLDAQERATPDNLLDGGTGRKQAMRGPVGQAAALAISIEPSAGSATPTEDQILDIVELA